MKAKRAIWRSCLYVLACVALCGLVNQTQMRAATLGDMNADSILFLGNSITLHGPYIEWLPDAHWGMAASEESKDYVHLLTSQINAASGGSMQVAHDDPLPGRWFVGDPAPNYSGNILNIADIFERTYDTWENGRIQNQINAQPDIVVLQFGENLSGRHGSAIGHGTRYYVDWPEKQQRSICFHHKFNFGCTVERRCHQAAGLRRRSQQTILCGSQWNCRQFRRGGTS